MQTRSTPQAGKKLLGAEEFDTSAEEDSALDTQWLTRGEIDVRRKKEDNLAWWRKQRFVDFESGQVATLPLVYLSLPQPSMENTWQTRTLYQSFGLFRFSRACKYRRCGMMTGDPPLSGTVTT